MTAINKLPEWLLDRWIMGSEGEDSGESSSDSGDEGQSDDDPNDAGSSSTGSEGSSGNSDEHDDANDPRTKGLRSALADERKRAKDLERENRRLARLAQEKADAEKGELEATKARAERAEQRTTRLTEGYRRIALDNAIRRAAEDARFIDPQDAIGGVDRSLIQFTQDDEDPTDIEIDAKSVKDAVKRLADSKKHWIKTGTGDGEPTGSTFGGAGRRQQKKTDDDTLRDKYPALRY